jgi:hypothetical protein
MSLLADVLSFDLEKQSEPVCSKIAILAVVVLFENKRTPSKKVYIHYHMVAVTYGIVRD